MGVIDDLLIAAPDGVVQDVLGMLR